MPDPLWGPVVQADGTTFRLWAPGVDRLDLMLGEDARPMEAGPDGWWSRHVPGAGPGTDYAFRLPGGLTVPDPAARAQAGDVHGPSRIDVDGHAWRHETPARPWHEAVVCELHVGTFTPEGTFRAAIDKLPLLAEAGYTAIEIMPVAQFGGDRGWGYDGVLLFAPHPAYGTPDDLRALVDAAHGHGLMVMLDVVYNHFGPDGNYLGAYAPDFFDSSRETPWGAAIAFDRAPVRAFFVENALHWLDAYRLDGFRFDAIDHVRDPGGDPEILVEIARAIRERRPGAWLATEDNRNVTHLHERDGDRTPLMSGEWNDDWHNAAHVLATGETEGYYEAFADRPDRMLARALAEGFAWQGETQPDGQARGAPSGHMAPDAFVDFLQNHDQIGNRARGERLLSLCRPETYRALQAMLMLSPHVPLMFMGDEWGARDPFLFFADFDGALGLAVTEGRRREFAGFQGFAGTVPDPIDPATFEMSKLDWFGRGGPWLDRFRSLARLRAERIVPLIPGTGPGAGRVLDALEGCVAVDWRLGGGTLRMRANLGAARADLAPAEGETIHADGTLGEPASCQIALA